MPDSANLLGVIDSTGTLGPNEVFIQIKRNDFGSKDKDNDASIRQVINEIVTRNQNGGLDIFQQEEEKKDFDISEISCQDDKEYNFDLLSNFQS